MAPGYAGEIYSYPSGQGWIALGYYRETTPEARGGAQGRNGRQLGKGSTLHGGILVYSGNQKKVSVVR